MEGPSTMRHLMPVVLSLLFISSCLCSDLIFGANYTPIVGTVIAGFAGDNNTYKFNCDQFCRDDLGQTVQITTTWSLENFLDFSNLVLINEQLHPEFFINGTDRGGPLPFPTYRNELTIVNLTQRLHNVRLYCGHAGDNTDGHWELRVYSPPALNSNLQVTLVEGEPLRIDLSEGQAPAFPYPQQLEWRKDGIVTSNSSRIEYGYPVFSISAVSREDNGSHTLSATNTRLGDPQSIIGTASSSVHLEVLYGPEIIPVDSSFVAVEGTEVTLICGTDPVGNPAPAIEWTDNGGNVIHPGNASFVFNNGPDVVSLAISDVTLGDSGDWRCRLTVNETGGVIERNLTLTVIAPPPQVMNISVEETGPTWLFISWEFLLNSSSVTHFMATVVPSMDGETVSVTVERVLSANLSGLLPGVEYRVHVVAITSLGGVMATSNRSIEVVSITNSTVPEIVCSNVISLNGVMTINWDIVHTGGINLSSVVVEYSTPELTSFLPLDNGVIPPTNLSEQTFLRVDSLVAGVFYTFRITASNEIGANQVVCPAQLHSTGIPQQPTILSGASNNPRQVVLSVTSPASGTQPLDSSFEFIVHVSDESSVVQFQLVIPYPDYVDGETVQIRVESGLIGGMEYRFEVGTRNQFGSSPLSAQIEVQVIESQQLPVAALAGGVAAGGVVLILLILVIVVALCLIIHKPKSRIKFERSDSLEMVTNQNYGKTKVIADTDGFVDPPQYEAIPISKPASQEKVYDQLAPSRAKESDNPLYSSTQELRMSTVYNTYDAIPAGTQSREHSRGSSPSPLAGHLSITQSPLPPRPKSQTVTSNNDPPLYSLPNHERTTSYPTYSVPAPTNKSNSSPPLPDLHLLDREHLRTPGEVRSSAGSRQDRQADAVYTEL